MLHADQTGLIVDGGMFYLQGMMESPDNTCTDPSILNSSSVYQCLDLDTLGLRIPDVTAAGQLHSIHTCQSLEVIGKGQILGSRIGLCRSTD